jgi:hypothetical protein
VGGAEEGQVGSADLEVDAGLFGALVGLGHLALVGLGFSEGLAGLG